MEEDDSPSTTILLNDQSKTNGNTDGANLDAIKEANTSDTPVRDTWQGKFDFLLSCIGYSVGLGNVWKFPYLCYKNGGGAFLVPYSITLLLAGIPMYFLELSLGQFHRKGALGVWDDMPGFRGLGYAFMFITFWIGMYYTVIIAWSLWYLFHSFRLVLPWSTCGNKWNTERCFNSFAFGGVSRGLNISLLKANVTNETLCDSTTGCKAEVNSSEGGFSTSFVSPEIEFWSKYTLDQSGGIDEPGSIHWQMALLLLLAWIVIYFCMWKGVKWSGKIMYVTALFPYVLIIVLLCRGASLPGAFEGVKFYLSPQIDRLADSQVWVDAASQIFYSNGVGFGAVIVLGSYNDFHHNIYRSAVIVSVVNSCTSFLLGFVIFCVLGFMAQRLGVSVADVTASGPGLAFMVYPSALSELPGAPIWASLFFIMLFMVGVDSEFAVMEGFFTTVTDEFPNTLRKRREVFIGVICLVSYLVGLSMVTQGGIYVFQLFDWYASSRVCLLFVVFWESVAIAWFYGADRFYGDIVEMTGVKPLVIFKYCWSVTVPLICVGVFAFSIVSYTPVTYQGREYPTWAEVFGWFLTLSSVLCVPVVMVSQVLKAKGTLKQRLTKVLFPPPRKEMITLEKDHLPSRHDNDFT